MLYPNSNISVLKALDQVLPEAGALREWQGELRKGLRTKYDNDPLYRAACAEANAREWTWHPPTCNEYRRQAAEILLERSLERAS